MKLRFAEYIIASSRGDLATVYSKGEMKETIKRWKALPILTSEGDRYIAVFKKRKRFSL